MTTTAHRTDLSLCRRLLGQARPYGLHLVGLFLVNLLSIPLVLLTPLPLKLAIDQVIGARPLPGFLEAVLPAAARSGPAVLALAAGLTVMIALLSQLQSV